MYSWYNIRPFPAVVSENYDESKDDDLRMLCKSIPDITFMVYHLKKSGTSIYIRIPKEYGQQLDSIPSFGISEEKYPVCAKISAFVQLRLRKKSIFPLVMEKEIHHDIFSMISNAPYGVFVLRLSRAPAKTVQKQFNSIRKKYKKKDTEETNFYERVLKSKAECEVFFCAEACYGVQDTEQMDSFESIIPCFGKEIEPNSWIRRNVTKSSEKKSERATDKLKKFLVAKSKKTNMILSSNDILPFICFPHDPGFVNMGQATTDARLDTAHGEDIPNPEEFYLDSK